MTLDKQNEVLVGRFRKLLEINGFTISYFADTYNIDRTNISRLFSWMQKDIRLSTLCKIAEAFGMTVSQLLDESYPIKKKP